MLRIQPRAKAVNDTSTQRKLKHNFWILPQFLRNFTLQFAILKTKSPLVERQRSKSISQVTFVQLS